MVGGGEKDEGAGTVCEGRGVAGIGALEVYSYRYPHSLDADSFVTSRHASPAQPPNIIHPPFPISDLV